jgi:hypothetical protein
VSGELTNARAGARRDREDVVADLERRRPLQRGGDLRALQPIDLVDGDRDRAPSRGERARGGTPV